MQLQCRFYCLAPTSTNRLLRDTSAWYHIIENSGNLGLDSSRSNTQGTGSLDTIK